MKTPTNLSPEGLKAFEVIKKVLEVSWPVSTEGVAFYSPQEWQLERSSWKVRSR